MPVSFNFDKVISNQKAVQSHITVTSSSGQQVAGHWFRLASGSTSGPRRTGRPGSKVAMKIDLDGVEGADRCLRGAEEDGHLHRRFQVTTVDVNNAQTMTVVRDGKTLKTVPISAGSRSTPRTTIRW